MNFKSSVLNPCVFSKRVQNKECIIAIYVDDLSLFGTEKAININSAKFALNSEFKMKDFGEAKICIGLQIVRTDDGIFIHQSNYIKNY